VNNFREIISLALACFTKAFLYLLSLFKNENKIKNMKVRESVLKKVAESYGCRKLIMQALSISAPTMTRYIQDNDDNLTKAASLKVIADYFNLKQDEVLEECELTKIDSVS
jgi:hypothetical protein